MRRLPYLFVLILFFCISCGPSVEEQAAAKKKLNDSISAAKEQMELAKEEARQQAITDSIKEADTTVTDDVVPQ